ncbi:class I SAM-dependent DNA methyltransferase [Kribbella sp. CA-293567]|uniref:class I SAM-dependent DNA methyltransferase n=1 Tax=Kribbella sp. CA-293567 TaxID=3002436 RepID=UPI0022DE4CE8|nr:class I SAM-dependent methyltransferase [Kribbella sp. CA-293567]WBQ05163.1 class I SAM-dependent methyltransferase [Kribbella sp. CA-293567]
MSAVPIDQPADLDLVRASYDRVADNYVEMNLTDVNAYPWLRTAIDGFANAVQGLGPVLDVGCGPGDVTAYLAGRGLDVSGVDLSARMIEHARRRFPEQRFAVASATELELADSSYGGILGWWSLFNLPRDVLAQVLRSFARALVPGGHFIIATHLGDGERSRAEAYGGLPVTWTTHLWQPEPLWALLTAAGLSRVAELRVDQSVAGVPSLVLVAQR